MTGAGLMDCKKALQETSGSSSASDTFDAAIEWLRKNGLAKAAKKSSRDANQGLIGLYQVDDSEAYVVEVNSETDFVSRNDMFRDLVQSVSHAVAKAKSTELDAVLSSSFEGDDATIATVQDEVHRVAASVGENIRVRRAGHVKATPSDKSSRILVGSYVHAPPVPGATCGQSVALVALECEASGDALDESALQGVENTLVKQICMHIVAASPKYLDKDTVDPEAVKKEEKILTDEAIQSGKNEKHIPKMVQGRMAKFYKEHCLLEQQWLLSDDKSSVSQILSKHASAVDGVDAFRIQSFVRYQLGEEDDTAAAASSSESE